MLLPFRSRAEQQVPPKKVSFHISKKIIYFPRRWGFHLFQLVHRKFSKKLSFSNSVFKVKRQSRMKQVRIKCQALKWSYWGSFPLSRPFLEMFPIPDVTTLPAKLSSISEAKQTAVELWVKYFARKWKLFSHISGAQGRLHNVELQVMINQRK